MWKKIRANTLMFIKILIFVKLFELFFSPSNVLVGVTSIIAILVLMGENLTRKPIKNISIILLINLSQGIFSHISSQNMWIGLILNFVSLFIVGYLLSSNLSKIKIVPFGLQYLFILYAPVTNDELRLRLISLIAGAFLIMISQFYIHWNKTSESKENIELIDLEKTNFTSLIRSVRGSYAIRLGLLTSIASFIIAYFQIENGRWIAYTVFSLTEFYYDSFKLRARQRIEGTIIGALIIIILFNFIEDNMLRIAIILLGGYLDTYTSNYRDKMICVTVSVMASMSMSQASISMGLQRLYYVLIGVFLTMIVDRLLLKRESKEESTYMRAA